MTFVGASYKLAISLFVALAILDHITFCTSVLCHARLACLLVSWQQHAASEIIASLPACHCNEVLV